ncbi:LolA family protein [Marinilabilia salmonicolor]|uniref:LolA family protein n=1 Tax=Marinilabilia salmonicolor TaxID=989 RepID=UPI00029A7624|nr:hypothetical protein [Marinilabilia salmonicolor]
MNTVFGKRYYFHKTVLLLLGLFSITAVHTSGQTYTGQVSVDALYQNYQKGNLFSAEASSFYDGQTGKIVTHYLSPTEFYKTINAKGETTIYLPDENTVSFMQNSHYSSKTELLYFFVNNLTQDMGLKHEGFTQIDTRREDNYIITTWQAPPGMQAVSSVELVSENFTPIYAQYFDNKGAVKRKIYYYDYYIGPQFVLPKKITEISYTTDNDSTIRRTTFSNIKTGFEADDKLFDFKIPEDAQKVDF